jgi:thioredoxin-related protein
MQRRNYFKSMVLGMSLLGGVLLLSGAGRRPGGAGSMTWMTVDQAAGKLQQEQRPVLIDLYTSWCGWCKEMDRKTYSKGKVREYLEGKFYCVRVDAETKDVITWLGQRYEYNPQFKSNMFALYLTHGRLEFPTTIIIPPGGAPQAIPGFMEPGELEPVVKYFGEGAYKTQGFDVWLQHFSKTW